MSNYVHGYSETEAGRLRDQASTLTDLLHHDTRYPDGCLILEAGCGAGSQTTILAERSPGARFLSIDRSRPSLDRAKEVLARKEITNVTLKQADLLDLDLEPSSVDHVFVCFVLEHLDNPDKALAGLYRILRPGGTLTVIEGDHGSFACHPETRPAMEVVQNLIDVQRTMGGDACVGRRLYPLLSASGFAQVRVSPRMVYVDGSRPEWIEGFSRKTFIAMVQGVREQAIDLGLTTAQRFDAGILDLQRAAGKDGVFCYTFFKAVAVRQPVQP